MNDFKQVIVLRQDLDMSKGKMIAQACHASLKAYKMAEESQKKNWESQGGKKIALDAGERKLDEMRNQARKTELPAALVKDSGLTELEPGTVTALGIGPAEEAKIDTVTGKLDVIE